MTAKNHSQNSIPSIEFNSSASKFRDQESFIDFFCNDEILNRDEELENVSTNQSSEQDNFTLYIQKLIEQLSCDISLTSSDVFKLNNCRQKDFKNNIGWDLFYALIARPDQDIHLKNHMINNAGYNSDMLANLRSTILNISAYIPDFHDIKSLVPIKERTDLTSEEKKILKKEQKQKKKEKGYVTPKVFSVHIMSKEHSDLYFNSKIQLFIEFDRHLSSKELNIYTDLYQKLVPENYIVNIKDEYDLSSDEEQELYNHVKDNPNFKKWHDYKHSDMYCAWQFDQRDRYWQAAMLASKLMTPKIIHLKNKCQNIRYKHDDDFEMAILETIYLAIPEYEKSKSNFAKFIVTYMMHTAYVYENDLSEYSRQQLELFIDSYDKRIEEGETFKDDIDFSSPDIEVMNKYEKNSFLDACKIANIDFHNDSFIFDHNDSNEVNRFMTRVQDYVLCTRLFNSLYINRLSDKMEEMSRRSNEPITRSENYEVGER